jgi:hypothetical protein
VKDKIVEGIRVQIRHRVTAQKPEKQKQDDLEPWDDEAEFEDEVLAYSFELPEDGLDPQGDPEVPEILAAREAAQKDEDRLFPLRALHRKAANVAGVPGVMLDSLGTALELVPEEALSGEAPCRAAITSVPETPLSDSMDIPTSAQPQSG